KNRQDRQPASPLRTRRSVYSGHMGDSFALLLAGVGLYGVLAYSVSRRTREIGIRAALGSTTGGIVRLIGREALILVAGGAVAGIAFAALAGRLLARHVWRLVDRCGRPRGIARGDAPGRDHRRRHPSVSRLASRSARRPAVRVKPAATAKPRSESGHRASILTGWLCPASRLWRPDAAFDGPDGTRVQPVGVDRHQSAGDAGLAAAGASSGSPPPDSRSPLAPDS